MSDSSTSDIDEIIDAPATKSSRAIFKFPNELVGVNIPQYIIINNTRLQLIAVVYYSKQESHFKSMYISNKKYFIHDGNN